MRRSLALPPIPTDAGESGDADSRPSKTRRKQAAHDVQSLGLALAELSDERLAAIEMPEPLLEAVLQYRRIRSHEARRRQMQYIGKLMRQADPLPIRDAVAAVRLGQARDAAALHACERWRDELIADDEASTRWLRDHPEGDPQQLRSLVRAARREAAPGTGDTAPEARRSAAPGQAPRKGRAYRELFRFLQQHPAAPAGRSTT